MTLSTVEEIERAIDALTAEEGRQLEGWLDRYERAETLDNRIRTDLGAGGLDRAVGQALDDEEHGRVRPL